MGPPPMAARVNLTILDSSGVPLAKDPGPPEKQEKILLNTNNQIYLISREIFGGRLSLQTATVSP